eukprot:5953147-Amphidinium_carterae.1
MNNSPRGNACNYYGNRFVCQGIKRLFHHELTTRNSKFHPQRTSHYTSICPKSDPEPRQTQECGTAARD